MTGDVISFAQRFEKAQCGKKPLSFLFEKHSIVLAGDELGALYLDPWATSDGDSAERVYSLSKDPFYPWERRARREAIASYMALAFAAHQAGWRDIVVDMSPAMQPGIDEATRKYAQSCEQKTAEVVFNALLASTIATPMDSIVQIAASLDMKVHALNSGLSGIATIFRETDGIATVPEEGSLEERALFYLKNGFRKDVKTLINILRRAPTPIEVKTMRTQMLLRLSGQLRENLESRVFDEKPTVRAIQETLCDRPFLGVFQNGRLFYSDQNLEKTLRETYADKNIATLALAPATGRPFLKHPQYRFAYGLKDCNIFMTEDHARILQERAAATNHSASPHPITRPKHNGQDSACLLCEVPR